MEPARTRVIPFAALGALLVLGVGSAALIATVQTPAVRDAAPPSPLFVRPTPSPLTFPPEPTPTPLPPYRPARSSLQKREIIAYFLEIALGPPSDRQDQRVVRWERTPSIHIRGQPSSEDRACVSQFVARVSPLMGPRAPTIAERDGMVTVYLLPKSQWSAANPDASPQDSAPSYTWWDTEYRLTRVDILIDAAAGSTERCYFLRGKLIGALGLRHLSSRYPESVFYAKGGPVGRTLTEIDRELIQLLYSPYIVSGLSRDEVLRRLE